MRSILESIHPVHCGNATFVAANEDIFNGDPATDVVNIKNAESIVFIIAMNNNAGSGAATITIEACDNVTPSNTTAIAFQYKLISAGDTQGAVTACASTGVSVGTAQTMIFIEVSAAAVAAASVNSTYNNHYVRLKATESQSDAIDGAITCFLNHIRYAELTATQLT